MCMDFYYIKFYIIYIFLALKNVYAGTLFICIMLMNIPVFKIMLAHFASKFV